MRAERAAKEN